MATRKNWWPADLFSNYSDRIFFTQQATGCYTIQQSLTGQSPAIL